MNNKQLPASTPTEESPIDWPYVCRDCGHGFDASMARQIDIVSDTEAEIMCSWCRHTATYDPPESDDIERPPEIVDHTVFTDDGLTTARLFFEGGAWLQYRRASDEWVYEELFTADGAEVASSKAEFERDDCETPGSISIERWIATKNTPCEGWQSTGNTSPISYYMTNS